MKFNTLPLNLRNLLLLSALIGSSLSWSGCGEDPVDKYITILKENTKHPMDQLDPNKESICYDAIAKLIGYSNDDERVVPALIEILTGRWTSYNVKSAIIGAAARIKDPRFSPSLISWVKSVRLGHDPSMCKSAVWALGEIGDTSTVSALIDAFTVQRSELTEEWVEAIPLYPNQPDYEELREQRHERIQKINNTYSDIRYQIIIALTKINQKHHIFPLADISSILDLLEDPWASFDVIKLLEAMKDKRALPKLKKFINNMSSDTPLRNTAEIALGVIEGSYTE